VAKFLNTTSINFLLEELIKKSRKNIILVSPYLKINPRIRDLLIQRSEEGITVQIVYGKQDLQQSEIDWLSKQPLIEVRFNKNLHAKCFMNEGNAIISSLNLYEFSQINNLEMGILITKTKDQEAFDDAHDEVQRLIRTSEIVTFATPVAETELELDDLEEQTSDLTETTESTDVTVTYSRLTTSKLAKKLGMKTDKLHDDLVSAGYLEIKGGNYYLTNRGKEAGGEFKKGQHGFFFLWPEDMEILSKLDRVLSIFKKG
jgi:phosphatidylserine/phosphatidylglycerophosphate/cardiolipin synthase-like enzyme